LRINGLGRAKENKRVALDANSEILQRIIFLLPLDFLKDWLVSVKEKIKLHTNSAKRRRALKGWRLALRSRLISTTLSTFVLKT
jgi:hypothetical protein